MALITFATIAATISDVTSEQIGRCHAVLQDGKTFYMVESEQDSTVEYKVTRSKKYGYRCTCKSGQYGFWNCKSVCKHVRWAVACRVEETAALAEQERLNSLKQAAGITYTDVDAQTLARIAQRNAAVKPASKYVPVARQAGFSLLK